MRPFVIFPFVLIMEVCLPVYATIAAPAPVSGASAAAPAKQPAVEVLGFLIGDWDASGAGQPGSSAGTISFQWAADHHALVRYNESATPSARHSDIMLIYPQGDSLRAIYTDSEGHTIEYGAAISSAGQRVVFESPGPGPRFRLWYHLQADSSLATGFEIAPPGSAEFKSYLEGVAHRKVRGSN